MKLRKGLCLLLTLFILIFSLNINAVSANSVNLSSRSSILIERLTGRVLYSQNCNQRLPMASTTKIMTALVALEHGNLDDVVKVHPKSVGVEGSSIYLKYDEEITLRDLLYGLMLRSGNDAATAIAYHVGKSVDGFVELMNKKAKEIGATNTNYSNPHGLHSENHYTTAYDLAMVMRAAMNNDTFKKISKTKLYISEGTVKRYFYNKNKTLWQFDGGDGGKTGYTKTAGRCLVSTATRNGMQLISVVLNDSNWFNDCYNLLSYGFDKYSPKVILQKNQFVKNISVTNGKKEYTSIINNSDIILPLTEEEKSKIEVKFDMPDQLKAPIIAHSPIGVVRVYLDGKLICSSKLLAYNEVAEKTFRDMFLDFLYGLFE